jgi:hypothetical protein
VAKGTNQLWLTDITEHPTREGKVYCCVVLDLYSRKAVGWAIDRRCESVLVNDAFLMAARSRALTSSTVIHSDHGSQGEINRSSQHLDSGGDKWRPCESDSERSSSIEDTFPRREDPAWRGERTGFGSGRRSAAA